MRARFNLSTYGNLDIEYGNLVDLPSVTNSESRTPILSKQTKGRLSRSVTAEPQYRQSREQHVGSRARDNRNSALRPARTVFKGNTDGMKNNVYQCHWENTDKQQFTRAAGVLEQHINKTFPYTKDVAPISWRTFTMVRPVQPKNQE